MTGTYLERRDPARNMARYYAVSVLPTLFGDWALVREWGRIGRPGTIRSDSFESEEEASAALARVAAQKTRRGYTCGNPPDAGDETQAGVAAMRRALNRGSARSCQKVGSDQETWASRASAT